MTLKETKKVVIINAGHHNHDPGKVIDTTTEAAEVKKIRDEVKRLSARLPDFTFHFVPDELTLPQSIKWANNIAKSLNDGLAVDIHLNANNRSTVRGTEGYHGVSSVSKKIAAAFSKHVAATLGLKDRGAFSDTLTYVGSLGWIRQTKMWATLVEVCYMTNAEDLAALTTDSGHTKAAKGLLSAVCELYGVEVPEWEPKPPQTPTPEAPRVTERFGFLRNVISLIFGRFSKTAVDAFDAAMKAKVAYEAALLAKQNVVGVGVGPKNGEGDMSVVVLVSKKEALSALDDDAKIPATVGGVKTDVFEVGEVTDMSKGVHTAKKRPVYGGLSAIHKDGSACTLGAVVYKDGQAYALQNVHCAHPHWKGAKLGDSIIQPSPNDGGRKRDVIGVSAEALELVLDGKYENVFDTALVKLSVDATEFAMENMGNIVPIPAEVKVGDVVMKSGRTTGVQKSKVLAVGVTVSVTYSKNAGVGVFKNQILAENKDSYFCDGGDSSSLVVNDKMQPVGQLFAGSNVIAIFSPIKPIMEHFGFEFSKEPVSLNEGFISLSPVDPASDYTAIDPRTAQKKSVGKSLVSISLRDTPSVSGVRKRVLEVGTRFEVIEIAGTSDGQVWAKVRVL